MERTDEKHYKRIVGRFTLNNQSIDIVVTRHGDFRILEERRLKPQELSDVITSIGEPELEHHFREAEKMFDANEKDWRVQTDYTIAIYDVLDEIVIMLGIHPHLKRVTIRTIISRVEDVVVKDIHDAYRVDTEETKNEIIREKIIPSTLKLKNVLLIEN